MTCVIVSPGKAQHALAAGTLSADRIVPIGALISRAHRGRPRKEEMTRLDGTWVCPQGLAVAAAVVDPAVKCGGATEADL